MLSAGVYGLEAKLLSAADLGNHFQSASFTALLGALSVLGQQMDLSVSQPTPEFGADPMAVIRRLRSR